MIVENTKGHLSCCNNVRSLQSISGPLNSSERHRSRFEQHPESSSFSNGHILRRMPSSVLAFTTQRFKNTAPASCEATSAIRCLPANSHS